MLRRMNRLSRDDPFWGGSNRRPTVPKIGEYTALVLREHPGDELALRVQAGSGFLQGSNSWGEDHWPHLLQMGRVAIEDDVLIALLHELSLGFGADSLAGMLGESSVAAAAVPMLERIASSGSDPHVVAWICDVIAKLPAA